MKKTLLVTTLALSVIGASAYAMGQGQGGGQGLGNVITAEERTKLQSITDQTEKQEYVQYLREKYGLTQGQGGGQGKQGQNKQGGNEDPAAMIADIPAGTVDETEITFLINQYGEEKMARDLYNYAAEKYPNITTFANIAKSEQKHMDSIQVLLDRYNITAPSDYAADNDLYEQLKAKIDLSEKDAIEAGIMVEMTDIEDIDDDIASTDNDDIKIILTRIGGASYNHLKGFVNALNNAGYTTDLEWTKYLSEDELNTKGPLTYKLAERLESEGISLPEQATSAYLKEQCANGHSHDNTQQGNGQRKGGQNGSAQGKMRQTMQNVTDNTKRYLNQEKVQKYKTLIEDKYAAKLDSYSQEKLEDINTKIDDLVEKIANSTSYSETTKETYINLLIALKASIVDRLDDADTDMVDDLLSE